MTPAQRKAIEAARRLRAEIDDRRLNHFRKDVELGVGPNGNWLFSYKSLLDFADTIDALDQEQADAEQT